MKQLNIILGCTMDPLLMEKLSREETIGSIGNSEHRERFKGKHSINVKRTDTYNCMAIQVVSRIHQGHQG